MSTVTPLAEANRKLDQIANITSLNGIYDDASNSLETIAGYLEQTGRPISLDGDDDSYEED